MSILTFGELRRIGQEAPLEARYNSLLKTARLEKSADQKPGNVLVFLSHSHTDNNTAHWAINLIKRYGGNAWVDWLDPEMPSQTNAETATMLKRKITSCQKFILLATPDALQSRWVPWELGYADSVKTLDNVALLPIRDDNYDYPENEYLGIYKSIQQAEDGQFGVFPPPPNDENGISLKRWLTS